MGAGDDDPAAVVKDWCAGVGDGAAGVGADGRELSAAGFVLASCGPTALLRGGRGRKDGGQWIDEGGQCVRCWGRKPKTSPAHPPLPGRRQIQRHKSKRTARLLWGRPNAQQQLIPLRQTPSHRPELAQQSHQPPAPHGILFGLPSFAARANVQRRRAPQNPPTRRH